MAFRYGFGWMGSKNKIAKELIDFLPAGEVFVDLFAGGCAMTHAAMLSGKYKRFVANDVKGMAVFFRKAIAGEVENLYEWISRDEFFARKDYDVKVASAWSFGTDGRTYLYSKEIEPLKRALYECTFASTHEARRVALHKILREVCHYLVFSEAGSKILASWCEERRVVAGADDNTRRELEKILVKDNRHTQTRNAFNEIRGAKEPYIKSFMVLSEQKSIEHLEHLEKLTSLASFLPAFTALQGDYRDVAIPAGAVVYADPPYEGVKGYGAEFNSVNFWQWVDAQDFPVFVSEYNAPEGFSEVFNIGKTCTLSNTNDRKTTERLFVQERFAKQYKRHEPNVLPFHELKEAINA